jgi:hypothetical protein
MKHLMGVYQVCSNKQIKALGLRGGGGGLYTGERPQGHHGPLVIFIIIIIINIIIIIM